MTSTITQTMEQFAFDGPLRLSIAIALGVVMLALFAWALWRERTILGRGTTILFWGLRCAAVVTVIWMLLAPTKVRVETSTTRRAVAIVTDTSGSMRTVDPAGTSDDVRWALAQSRDIHGQATRAADQAIAAVGIAQRNVMAAIEALRQHKPERDIVEAISSGNRALTRATAHLQAVDQAVTARNVSGNAGALAGRLLQLLSGPEFEAFAQLSAAFERGRTPAQKGWRESLPDLEHRLAGMRRSLFELARQVSIEESRHIEGNSPTLMAAVQKAPRLERTRAFLGHLQTSTLQPLGDKADVHWHHFDRKYVRLADSRAAQQSLKSALGSELASSAASGTDVAAALEQLQRERQDQPLAAVILLSDMAHNQASDRNPRDVAATLGDTPVHVVPLGNTRHVRDVLLQSVYAPAVAMRNDDIVIEVRLQAYECEGEVCVVQLLHEGEVIDFREVPLDSDFATRTVRFDKCMSTVGIERLQVAVTPLAGELTEENNYDDFEVNVTRSDIKVLVSDEMPRWEYRYLTQLFRRDPKVECDELLFRPRLIATGRREASKAVPITVDDWDQYDVVVLGDLPPEHLPATAQEALIEYVQQRGGTLVLVAGSEAMPQAYVGHPLEQVMPVVPVTESTSVSEAGYAFHVTEEGQNHYALMIGESEEATRTAWDFVNRFAPLYEVSAWRRPRPAARTLIEAVPRDGSAPDASGSSNAFLCWQPVGRGRIVYLSGPETYRLRFLRGDRLHYRFWGQLLRWAIASDLSVGTEFVRISTDKARYDSRETVQATVRLQDVAGAPAHGEGLQLRLTSGEDERTVPLAATDIPGEYRAEIHALPVGVYRIEPLGPAVEQLQAGDQQEPATASFMVQADLPRELVDTRSDRALAQQIADITGGQVVPPTAVAEIIGLTNLEPIVSERTERRPLWLRWRYLWLVFGCLQIEWVIRKWKGLS